jgi:hypothetical protein
VPARPVIEDLRIAGSAGRLAGLSARLDYARPPHRWGDFTDALRERDWRARLAALREEPTTISSFDGGRDRDLAAGPVGDDPAAWLAWMKSRIAVWRAHGRSGAEVSQIVWSEAESAWHLRHHPAADPNRCAGCGRRMFDAPGMSLLDGGVVHVGFDCLIAHGAQWRQAASDALMSLLEEQAAIAEFVGGLARAAAERRAWAEMIGKSEGAAR